MKVFSWEKFKSDCLANNVDPEEHFWAKVADGHEVVNGKVFGDVDSRTKLKGFAIDDDWCEVK